MTPWLLVLVLGSGIQTAPMQNRDLCDAAISQVHRDLGGETRATCLLTGVTPETLPVPPRPEPRK